MFKFITTRPLWVNFLAVIVLILLLVLFFFAILGWLTKHAKYEKVPAVTGLNVDQATKILEDKGFDVSIQDSIYVDTAARLSVIRQSPDADATVKANRTIYITINRAVPPLTTVPNMVGFSFRSAEMMLQSLGLKLGDTSYRVDYAKNSVLEQLYQGKPIAPNTKVPMGSIIDFVLANGAGSETMNVPDMVIGMTLGQAKDYLRSMNISIGAIGPPDLSTNDAAYVERTNPAAYSEVNGQKIRNKIKPGQALDLIVSLNKPVPDVVVDTTPVNPPQNP